MKYTAHIFSALICLMLLSGCVTRENADKKLEKACEAAIKAVLTEGLELKEVLGTSFGASSEGDNLRAVNLKATETDGWLDYEQSYKCIFEESFSFLNLKHEASVYRLNTGENIYGQKHGQIIGSVEDFTKIEKAIQPILY